MADEAARRRTLYLTVVAAIVVWLAYLAREAVVPLLVALILAYVLAPVVRRVEGRGLSRIAAVGALFLVFFGGTALVIGLGGPPLFRQAQELLRATLGEPARTITELPGEVREQVDPKAPPTLAMVRRWEDESEPPEAAEREPPVTGNYERHLQSLWDSASPDAAEVFVARHQKWRVTHYKKRDVIWNDQNGNGRFEAGYLVQGALWASAQVRDRLRSVEGGEAVEDFGIDALRLLTRSLALHSGEVALGALGVLGMVMRILGWLVIVPLFTFVFLMHLENVWSQFQRYLPGTHRDRVLKVLGEVHLMLLGFFRGRMLTMLLKGLFVGAGLAIVGVPFWPVFGAAAGLLTIIPAAGPVMAAAPTLILSFAEAGPTTTILAAVVLLAAELVEAYILIPQLVGREVGLHPVAVVAAILVGAALLGLLGVVLAIPLAAAARIVWREYVLPDLEAKAAETEAAA